MVLGSGIRDPGSGKKPIPDPGSRVKKAPDPGSGSATLIGMVKLWQAEGSHCDAESMLYGRHGKVERPP